MTDRPIWEIAVRTTAEAEEAVAFLMEKVFRKSACSYVQAETEAARISIFHHLPLKAAQREELRTGLRDVAACGLDITPGEIASRRVTREDWRESWKKHFQPIEIGSQVLIQPSWSRRRPRRGQAFVVLDPGLSFGTGQHPTTRFCLEQLVRARNPSQPQSFLDLGTGSGILAVTAAKIGYFPVDAWDLDPVAVRTARANARRNRVQRQIDIRHRDLARLPLASHTRYDIIGANLTPDLLLKHSDKILRRLRPAGRLVVAGILKTQFPELDDAYRRLGLRLISSRREREWQSGVFVPQRV